MKNHVTAEQNARDMLERMGVPDAQEYSAGELVELANLIVRADTPVALAEAYRCGKEAGDAGIAELRQQLANALAANEQNLKVYHAAAAELRQQLAEKETQRQNLMTAYQRQGDSAQVVITELRQQLAQSQADLAETECRRRTLGEQLVEAQARLETSDGISRRNETIRLLDLDRAKLRQQLAKHEKQIKLYEQALLASWPEGAIGEAFDFWNAARKLATTEPKP